jgi:hypothetical protein
MSWQDKMYIIEFGNLGIMPHILTNLLLDCSRSFCCLSMICFATDQGREDNDKESDDRKSDDREDSGIEEEVCRSQLWTPRLARFCARTVHQYRSTSTTVQSRTLLAPSQKSSSSQLNSTLHPPTQAFTFTSTSFPCPSSQQS